MQFKTTYIIIGAILSLIWTGKAYAVGPPVAEAGNDTTVCLGDSITLGGSPTASSGTAPYTYNWTPAANMNNAADPNPRVKITATTQFILTVIDNNGIRAFDTVNVTVDPISLASAGNNATICAYFDSATIGSASNPPVNGSNTYSWSPTTGLGCPICPTTIAKPSFTTTYTLTATDGKCTSITNVTVTVLPPPVVTTTSPVTINRGESATLNVTGLTSFIQWSPVTGLSNPNIPDPVASPIITTTYTVIGKDANGCIGFDSVVVDVINDSALIFYNTFTPNGDGINDTWYIGNIDLFPQNEVLVFNRYGQQIYRANGYLNQWNGQVDGANVPDATYYYIVYTGTGKTYTGSVTIIRLPK